MAQADFAYEAANDPAGLPLTVSVHADRPHLREQMREDAEAAGFRLLHCAPVDALLSGEARALGDVVLLDCPELDAAAMAALCRLDVRAARSGAQLVVSTTLDALEEVFACLDASSPHILVDPARPERVLALGQALALRPGRRVRELSEEDRLTLLRLTEQVNRIAERLDSFDAASRPAGGKGLHLASPPAGGPGRAGAAIHPDGEAGSLPDPRLVRRIIRQRQLRARFFDGDLFADPAWDMLLDLTAARAENVRVSVTSLCIASGVPPTTALRWIGQMTEAGLLARVDDRSDRRRAFIGLTETAAEGMIRYFAELAREPALPV